MLVCGVCRPPLVQTKWTVHLRSVLNDSNGIVFTWALRARGMRGRNIRRYRKLPNLAVIHSCRFV